MGTRLREAGVRAEVIAVGIKSCDLNYSSHQMTLGNPTNITSEIHKSACRLFDELWEGAPIRHLGIHTSRIRDGADMRQIDMFDNTDYEKLGKRDAAVEMCIRDSYNLLSGNVTGSRMDIETYVQRCYLERILYAANRRFEEMSAGQFELRMFDIDKAGKGKNRGLDLMVYSTVTGKEREVRTLSGGESFMAALCLALGMADQIQESAASVNLDMMFIDEGFGSLDEHSRAVSYTHLNLPQNTGCSTFRYTSDSDTLTGYPLRLYDYN